MGLFSRLWDYLVAAILSTIALPLLCLHVFTFWVSIAYFLGYSTLVFVAMGVRMVVAARKPSPDTPDTITGRVSINSISPTTPSQHPRRSESLASLASTVNTPRDFEGVGGWLPVADGDEDQAFSLEMNSSLHFPSPSRRRRSLTSNSVRSSMINSPEIVMGSARHRRRPSGQQTPGSVSPQTYFNVPPSSSMTAISTARMPGTRPARGDQSALTASDDEAAGT